MHTALFCRRTVVALLLFFASFHSARADEVLLPEEFQARQVFFAQGGAELLVVDGFSGHWARLESVSGRFLAAGSFDSARLAPDLAGQIAFATDPANHRLAVWSPWRRQVITGEGNLKTLLAETPSLPAAQSLTVLSNPQAVAFTPEGRKLLIACDPPGQGDREVVVVDLRDGGSRRIAVPGSSNLRGLAVDPAGKFALAVHLLPKADLPATQIEQGWVFTNAISVIPLDSGSNVVTLPLDLRTRGFANPEGVALSADGRRAWVAHAGADRVSVIDVPALLGVAAELPGGMSRDDRLLTRRYVRERIAVGAAPRALALSPDGETLAVANRLENSISMIHCATTVVTQTIRVPYRVAERSALVRLGERLFSSGDLSFSGQFSCASCHPDGTTDGLNWDLPADGFNNFHNTKTLLGTAGTAPYGWTGASPGLRERFEGTLRHLFQREPSENESTALEAYLAQLGYPSGRNSPAERSRPEAIRGAALFRGAARCSECHSGERLTDRALHDVGTGAGAEGRYDTPSLVGVRETGPWLHDGRAATLEEIFSRHNSAGLHGEAHRLGPAELADLVAYLKSL